MLKSDRKTMIQETYIVTGGAGFIGSNLVRYLLRQSAAKIVVVDKLTYAGNLASLEEVSRDPRYAFVQADIADAAQMQAVFKKYDPSGVFNLAAESHVDRSIDSPGDFIHTNVVGTFVLLHTALSHFSGLSEERRSKFRFLHVSTDEVYGSLPASGLFTEQTPYAPNSPYSASKASADHLVRAYFETYKLPGIITNCSNNYGPFQFPEKLIPLVLLNALEGKPLPIYGDGMNVRDWLYVEDHCSGIYLAFQKGRLGEKYNIGGRNERANIQIVDTLCDTLETFRPAAANPALKEKGVKSYRDLKVFVKDRPGHDRRYAIDADKISSELGWKAAYHFETGIVETVKWYLANEAWCHTVQDGKRSRERLGVASAAEGKK